ncbi:carboxylesterase/lipase family protein [Krasilnikoviella flava]|uniref:Carboxylic ester hydrolase n=1 Tax=Krasilnikoviella flava TaxID=526729 RepID=A0A1T5L6E6_9MICO|nr:carboxylesterase family protein [Krasilnikoviella flava]SKC71189.1 para-nitrobenzyl esterase [Krasilnikoviella flava]
MSDPMNDTSTRPLRRRTVAALVAALALLLSWAPGATARHAPEPAPARPPGTTVVRVDSGWLRGHADGDHVAYSGVPYAAPPVGERRWRPPAPPRDWAGTRDATAPSPLCPQGRSNDLRGQEDCLVLDVTAPAHARRGDRLPVLVWLHGGGLDSGGAVRFDGARLATEGGLVVVTVNYRLGALGFLSTSELGPHRGNYGLMDQAAALRWVQRNAAAFGGDPGSITLAGQSGGARSVCAQLAAPTSRTLFDRAIVQSGACANPVPDRARAQAFGDRAVEHLGCTDADDVAACLRRSDLPSLVGTLDGVGYGLTEHSGDRPWNPVAGTPFLPQQPIDAIRRGAAARVPLLIGATRDEMRGFVHRAQPALTAEGYRSLLAETFGADTPAVLDAYPLTDHDSPTLALAAVLGDRGAQIGACPVLRTARAAAPHQPVHVYEFAEDAGPDPDDGFPRGAYHGLELPYLWTLVGDDQYPPLGPAQRRLSATMIDYWAAFARTGDVNGPGRPHWARFGPGQTVVGLSTQGIRPTPFAADHRCDLWTDVHRPGPTWTDIGRPGDPPRRPSGADVARGLD